MASELLRLQEALDKKLDERVDLTSRQLVQDASRKLSKQIEEQLLVIGLHHMIDGTGSSNGSGSGGSLSKQEPTDRVGMKKEFDRRVGAAKR